MVNYPSCISDSSHCFSPFSCVSFLPPPTPTSPLSLASAVFPLSPLLLLPRLSTRCCHANFPGDSVVMDTERQGRSADVWCRSGMCTNRSPVCALFSFPFSQRGLFVVPEALVLLALFLAVCVFVFSRSPVDLFT